MDAELLTALRALSDVARLRILAALAEGRPISGADLAARSRLRRRSVTRQHPKNEVNMRLALRHADVASLRRYLVDEGFMKRSGGIYGLLPREGWPI